MPDTPHQRRSIWQWLLGLFVAWQLFFLISTNALAFLPLADADDGELSDSRGPLPGETPDKRLEPVRILNHTLMSWAQATGQVQAWWLFAPSFPPNATFPVVTLHWNHSQSQDVVLHSHQEPENPEFYVRLPCSSDRLFHYEMRLGLVAAFASPESLEKQANEWSALFQERVKRQSRTIRAYLRWRMQSYLADQSDLPEPDELTLSIAIYRSPDPGPAAPTWTAPLVQPLARWHPVQTDLEYFDQARGKFFPLEAKE